jgi:hypothetical protein
MSAAELKRISLEEVSKHKDPKGENKQVWIVIHDHVYDVTKFMDEVRKLTTLTQGCQMKYFSNQKSQFG